MSAKTSSLIGMIVGAVGLLAVFVIVIIKFMTSNFVPSVDQAFALLLIGMAPSVPFSPVYVSIIMDKIADMKGKKNDAE